MTNTINEVLKNHGIGVVDLQEWLASEHNVYISYDCLRSYCIATSEKFGKPEKWLWIKKSLLEMEVMWS